MFRGLPFPSKAPSSRSCRPSSSSSSSSPSSHCYDGFCYSGSQNQKSRLQRTSTCTTQDLLLLLLLQFRLVLPCALIKQEIPHSSQIRVETTLAHTCDRAQPKKRTEQKIKSNSEKKTHTIRFRDSSPHGGGTGPKKPKVMVRST